MTKKIPSRSEMRSFDKKLGETVRTAAEYSFDSMADKVYDNDKEVVLSSIFKRKKPISPIGGNITLDEKDIHSLQI